MIDRPLLIRKERKRHVPLTRLALSSGFEGTFKIQLHLINGRVEVFKATLKSVLLFQPPSILGPVRPVGLGLQRCSPLLHGNPPLVPQHWQEVPRLGQQGSACILWSWSWPSPTLGTIWWWLLVHHSGFFPICSLLTLSLRLSAQQCSGISGWQAWHTPSVKPLHTVNTGILYD